MLKDILLASIQSSLAASIIVTLTSFFYFEEIAFLFGVVAFFVAFFWCMLFSYPLIILNKKYGFSDLKIFFIYVSVGFLLGALTQRILFRVSFQQIDIYTVLLLCFYGGCGAVSSLPAWNYIRKNVSTKNPI